MRNCLRRFIYLAVALSVTSTVIYGQNYKSDVSKGDFALKKGDYEAAAKLYSEAIKSEKNLGKGNLDILYKLGFSQMQIKNYSDASVTYAQYINIAKNSSADLNLLKDVLQWKDWCDNEFRNQPLLTITGIPNTDMYLTNMRGLNSTLNDLSITLDNKNEIIFFTSNRVYFDEKKLIVIKTNLFSTELHNSELSEPIKIGAGINSLGEIISACLASDNKTLYFTVANDDQTKADIYVCNFTNGKFEQATKLPKIINSKYFDGYPSISNDGKSLYFVSDRPGGMGGKDIYVCRTLPDGTWSEPYNLGKNINTKYDEITPHIDKTDETLYFSSKGHPGNGGFDIFYSKVANKARWGVPVNMVEPVNSKSDDIAYITTSDPTASYFSSSRKGGMGNFDIYKTGKNNGEIPIEEKPLALKEDNKTETDSLNKKNEIEANKKIAEPEQSNQPSVATNITPASETAKTTVPKKAIEPPKPIETPKPIEISKSNEPAKTTVIAQTPKQVPIVKPNISLPLNKDTAILNSSIKGLAFRVQLGAFRNQITTNSSYFDKLNKNAIKEELSPEMLYKYTIGSFENISRATNAKQVLRESGYSDAFLACYLEGKRVTMNEVLMMLDKKVNNRVAIYQK
jgi:hypothetical protein